MATDIPLTKRLKRARLASKLSQKKLGIAIGIDEFGASARMNQLNAANMYLLIKQ